MVMTKNKTVGWHYQLDGHEFEQALGVGDGQGSLACCSPWGHKESGLAEWLNWTELIVAFLKKKKKKKSIFLPLSSAQPWVYQVAYFFLMWSGFSWLQSHWRACISLPTYSRALSETTFGVVFGSSMNGIISGTQWVPSICLLHLRSYGWLTDGVIQLNAVCGLAKTWLWFSRTVPCLNTP